MNCKSIFAISLFVFSSVVLGIAQVPTNLIGGNPHRLKWKQINTEYAQIVFPEGQEGDGRRVANLIAYLGEQDNDDIGQLKQKVSIFLQGHRVNSNGLVTVGPFRSEFYQTSPQMANITEYLDLSLIHI